MGGWGGGGARIFGLASKAESDPFWGREEERESQKINDCLIYSSWVSGQEQIPSSRETSQRYLSPLSPKEAIHSWILSVTDLAPKMVCLHHHSPVPHEKTISLGSQAIKKPAQNHKKFLAPQWAWVNNYVTAVLQLFIQITIQYFLNKSELTPVTVSLARLIPAVLPEQHAATTPFTVLIAATAQVFVVLEFYWKFGLLWGV